MHLPLCYKSITNAKVTAPGFECVTGDLSSLSSWDLLVFKRALASVATAADSQVMLNSFDILRTKISFLVVKVMGALPDAEAGWVQAFPCCFGAWSVEVPCRGPAYVSWGYLENVICIRNDIIRFLCIFGPKLARVLLLFFFIPFQLLHWYFNRLTQRFFPSHTFLAFEGHLSQTIKKTYKWSIFFCFSKKVVILL